MQLKIYGLKLRDIVAPPKRLVLDADPVSPRGTSDEIDLTLERFATRRTGKTNKTEKTQKSGFSLISDNWKARFSASIRHVRQWGRRESTDKDG